MTTLPDLQRALYEAAARLELDSPPTPRIARNFRHSIGIALGLVATTSVAAIAASTLLETGSSVPKPTPRPAGHPTNLTPEVAGTRRVLELRTADPDGGLPWAAEVHRRQLTSTDQPPLLCLQVARTQEGVLGIVGRDGSFGNDQKFHPLAPDSDQGPGCRGVPAGYSTYPAVWAVELRPASGAGVPTSGAGGCVPPTPRSSPPTHSAARNAPDCRPNSLRLVAAGFAGPKATKVTLTGANQSATTKPSTADHGAYLIVAKPPAGTTVNDVVLTIRYADGRECHTTKALPITCSR